VPKCSRHHDEFHRFGKFTFENRYSIDLDAEAERIAGELDALGYE